METIQQLVELVRWCIDFVLHMDRHLNEWIAFLGPSVYGIFFLIIFCETGLIITPFLPGDSFLFALGALTSSENAQLRVELLILTMLPAAILGDAVNYSIGRLIGSKVHETWLGKFVKPEHIARTQRFYDRHGGKTIILARFVPIIRTFAPFVAGVANMQYRKFGIYNVVGAVAWVPTFVLLGRWFGNLPAVKDQFHVVIFGIIFVSLIPIAVEWWKARKEAKALAGN